MYLFFIVVAYKKLLTENRSIHSIGFFLRSCNSCASVEFKCVCQMT